MERRVSQPTAYDRDSLNGETYFTSFSTSYPTTQQEGNKLDQEFNAIALTLAQTLANLALIQRDDGELANDSVGRDQLASEVVTGINTPTTWAALTDYGVRDTVIVSAVWYWANTEHTSAAAFATDLASGYWETVFDFTSVFQTMILATTTPAALGGGATVGSALTAARADHVHQIAETDELYLRNHVEFFQ